MKYRSFCQNRVSSVQSATSVNGVSSSEVASYNLIWTDSNADKVRNEDSTEKSDLAIIKESGTYPRR